MYLKATSEAKSAIKFVFDSIHFVLFFLQFLFGGSLCPSCSCATSRIVSDIINDLVDNNGWDKNLPRLDFVNNMRECKTLIRDVTFFKSMETISRLDS